MNKLVAPLAVAALLAAGSTSAWAGPSPGYSLFGSKDPNTSSGPLSDYTNSLEAYGALATSAGGSVAVERFEGLAVGATTATIQFGSGSSKVNASLSGGEGFVAQNQGPNEQFNGRYSVGPDGPVAGETKFWQVTASSAANTFLLSFDKKVKTFGFFGVDIGDFNGTLLLDFLGAGGATLFSINLEDAIGRVVLPGSGSVLYFGINVDSDRPDWFFEGVRFTTAVSSLRAAVSAASTSTTTGTLSDTFGFDSFTVVAAPGGTTPPNPASAPGTAFLLAAALAGLALTRRRR